METMSKCIAVQERVQRPGASQDNPVAAPPLQKVSMAFGLSLVAVSMG